jgi:hypothetical protein
MEEATSSEGLRKGQQIKKRGLRKSGDHSVATDAQRRDRCRRPFLLPRTNQPLMRCCHSLALSVFGVLLPLQDDQADIYQMAGVQPVHKKH